MRMALAVAAEAAASSDVPVGAVVVDSDGVVRGMGHNVREAAYDPTGHAEVVALRAAAGELGRWRLDGTVLVVTLEPCVMCTGAAVAARVDGIVFGAWDEKAGACGSVAMRTFSSSPVKLRRHTVAQLAKKRWSRDRPSTIGSSLPSVAFFIAS